MSSPVEGENEVRPIQPRTRPPVPVPMWRESLQINMHYFNRLKNCEPGREYFDRILQYVYEQLYLSRGNAPTLDVLAKKIPDDRLRKIPYQFKSDLGLNPKPNMNPALATGIFLSAKTQHSSDYGLWPEMLAVIISQSYGDGSDECQQYPAKLSKWKQNIATRIGNFLLPWQRESNPYERWPFPAFQRHDFLVDRQPITLEFHFRYMSLVVEKPTSDTDSMTSCLREEGDIPSLRAENQKRVQEKRHMLMLRLFPTQKCSHFTIVSVGDIEIGERVYVMSSECTGSLTPMILYIKYLRRLLVEYTSEWYAVLAQIAREVDPTISDLSDYDPKQLLMFDDKDDNLSVTYFKIFQLLRTCGNMIEETHQDFRDWHAKALMTFKNDFGERLDAQGPVTDGDMKKMREEWNQWKNKLEGRFEGLRGRFKDKQQDVMSLTGSLQNFIAVNEAKQSTRQNRYVLVFTTATVIYLPLSFVTVCVPMANIAPELPSKCLHNQAIFSMNNIRDESPLYQSMRPFAWTLIALALATYAVAGISILHMRGTTSKAAEKLKVKKKLMEGKASSLLKRHGSKSDAPGREGDDV